MTSIHASISVDLRASILLAKARGGEHNAPISDDPSSCRRIKGDSTSPSDVVLEQKAWVTCSTQSFFVLACPDSPKDGSLNEVDNESPSKENGPTLSAAPIPILSPRRSSLVKRPLSDLPTFAERTFSEPESTHLSPMKQHTKKNGYDLHRDLEHEGPVGGDLCDEFAAGSAWLPHLKPTMKYDRPSKRTCSDESKQRMSAERRPEELVDNPSLSTGAQKAATSKVKLATTPRSLGARRLDGKARTGLRRL